MAATGRSSCTTAPTPTCRRSKRCSRSASTAPSRCSPRRRPAAQGPLPARRGDRAEGTRRAPEGFQRAGIFARARIPRCSRPRKELKPYIAPRSRFLLRISDVVYLRSAPLSTCSAANLLRRASPRPEIRSPEYFHACRTDGHPERRYPCVHIAGTNGKGSTAAISNRFSAPRDFEPDFIRRRISSASTSASASMANHRRRRFAACADRVPAIMESRWLPAGIAAHPTFFECLTAMAFDASAQRVEFAVYEVGMGGRLDATSVVIPEVCGDHPD